jgi:hypothetical protein
MWKKYQRSVDLVEGHITKGCDMGTNEYSPIIFSPTTLKRRFLLKGEGMLGYDINPSPWVTS